MKSFDSVTIDVVIPCFGRASELARALTSIDNQSDPPTGVVAVFDQPGNTELLQMLNGWRPRNYSIHIVINETNQGIAMSSRIGAQNSKSTYVCFLDMDDELTTDCVAEIRSAILVANASDIEPIALFTNREDVAKDRVLVKRDFNAMRRSMNAADANAEHTYLSHLKVYQRSFIVDETIPAQFDGVQDWYWNIRLFERTNSNIILIPRVLYRHHIHEAQSSNSAVSEKLFAINRRRKSFLRITNIEEVKEFWGNSAEDRLLYEQVQHEAKQLATSLLVLRDADGATSTFPYSAGLLATLMTETAGPPAGSILLVPYGFVELGNLAPLLRTAERGSLAILASKQVLGSVETSCWGGCYADLIIAMDLQACAQVLAQTETSVVLASDESIPTLLGLTRKQILLARSWNALPMSVKARFPQGSAIRRTLQKMYHRI